MSMFKNILWCVILKRLVFIYKFYFKNVYHYYEVNTFYFIKDNLIYTKQEVKYLIF